MRAPLGPWWGFAPRCPRSQQTLPGDSRRGTCLAASAAASKIVRANVTGALQSDDTIPSNLGYGKSRSTWRSPGIRSTGSAREKRQNARYSHYFPINVGTVLPPKPTEKSGGNGHHERLAGFSAVPRGSENGAEKRGFQGNRGASLVNVRLSGGAGGIRTLDTLLAYTHFPGERLRPLGHRSACSGRGGTRREWTAAQDIACG